MAVEYIGVNGPDGMCLGLTSAEKVAFYGATPAVQPSAAAQAAVTATVTTTQTTTTLKADLAAVIVLANRLRTDLVALGLIKGSA